MFFHATDKQLATAGGRWTHDVLCNAAVEMRTLNGRTTVYLRTYHGRSTDALRTKTRYGHATDLPANSGDVCACAAAFATWTRNGRARRFTRHVEDNALYQHAMQWTDGGSRGRSPSMMTGGGRHFNRTEAVGLASRKHLFQT